MTAADTVTDEVDYKSTVFLPRTEFPMRAGLPKREPELLERWLRADLYRRLRDQSKGRETFLLHDATTKQDPLWSDHIGEGSQRLCQVCRLEVPHLGATR